MLWAFGTRGQTDGSFTRPSAIDHMGRDLFCLDSLKNTITVFTPTEYGSLIYEANSQYLDGDYDISADTWRGVLKLNANYNLAFIGIGRSLLRQGEYSEAMRYFKMAHDRTNYGRAFRLYRKVWVEENITWIAAGLLILVLALVIPGTIKKMKGELESYERQQVKH